MEMHKDKHFVISSGGSGIGASIAETLAKIGANTTIMRRHYKRLQEKAGQLPLGFAEAVDVTEQEKVNIAFQKAIQQHGVIDILINNAGNAISLSFEKMKAEQWNEMISLNLTGIFHCKRTCLP